MFERKIKKKSENNSHFHSTIVMQRSCQEIWDMIAVLKIKKANDSNNEYKVEQERGREGGRERPTDLAS